MDITTLILAKKYTDNSLTGLGALKGMSAYEIAKANGFVGSEIEWLTSLQGTTPHIGTNGHWFIGEVDTNIVASPELAGYITEDTLPKFAITELQFNGLPILATNGVVNIPIAINGGGLVKSSNKENFITVTDEGEMEVSSLNVNKLTQTTGEELILQCNL